MRFGKKPCVVGIDIGTSSCKTLAVNEEGRVLSRATREYPVYNPLPGWSEQNPLDWWEAAKATLSEVSWEVEQQGYAIEGIGLTGQMQDLCSLMRQELFFVPVLCGTTRGVLHIVKKFAKK